MTDLVLLLERGKAGRTRLVPRHAELVDTVEAVRERARQRQGLWLAASAGDLDLLRALNDQLIDLKGDHRLVVRDRVGRGRSQALRAKFRYVLSADQSMRLLPFEELIEAVASPERRDLIIGVAVDAQDRSLVVFRGSLEPLVVPMSFFGLSGTEEEACPPFEPIDFGHGIRFGDLEASSDAVLYAFDADYRRRRKALRAEQDTSLGGSLRRLRLLRRLARDDFDGVSAKEVARIERGEVERPHPGTLKRLAQRLGVEPEEIASY